MSRKISLAYLTLPGIEPVEQIKIAAKAGYDFVSLRTIPMGQQGEPQVHLEKDPELFNQIKATLKETNMKVLDIELVRIKEDVPTDFRGAFEKAAELGAKEVLSSIWTTDYKFAVEQYKKVCAQAAEFGLNMNFEFPAVSGVKTLEDTLKLQEQVGAPNLKVLMDMLYCNWDGLDKEIEMIKKAGPERFGVIHLCDCPKNYAEMEKVVVMREAREYCGKGVIDLAKILKALPANNCSIELPNKKYIEQYGQYGHAKNCLDNARAVFAKAGL
jgi:sugar phosphate isomerase/epimerase